jgi:multiple sugar transport system permease protein
MTTLTKNPAPGALHAGAGKPKPASGLRRLGDLKIALFFIAPAMIGFIVFYVVPTIRGST